MEVLTPWWFLVGVLAAFRITRLLAIDTLLEPWRDRLVDSMPAESKLSYLIECPFCVGWWVALAVVFVLAGWGDVGRWALLPWAVAGGQALLASVDARLNG